MNVPVTERFRIQDARDLYGVSRWGAGYFYVGENGHLHVTPTPHRRQGIDLFQVTQTLTGQGMRPPFILRCPQLLGAQVRRLCGAFSQSIEEYGYAGRFVPAFPIKVNQQRSVVEGLLEGGREHQLSLEVGSRAELLVALALDAHPESLLICNGYKDEEYLEAAVLAVQSGRRVIVVIEKPFELDAWLRLAGTDSPLPTLGFRLRLQARGSGLWEKSGGSASKFGLTTRQLLSGLEALRLQGLEQHAQLLHFHIGSQITEIRKIKVAIREASRIYAKLRKQDVHIKWLDVGGGLGIDYDGSRTSSDASTNYSVQEYANDVVFGVQEICEQEAVDPPTLLSESGRMLTAYHSILVTNVHSVIEGVDPDVPTLTGDEHQTIRDLNEILATLNVKNYREFYHDAIEYRDQIYALFNLGMLSLDERAKGEGLFWGVAQRVARLAKSAKFMADEFVELNSKLHDKYICNFSVFQSLPDHWALDQLFPVMPIHRLDETPDRRGQLVDITCDSDGEVERFIDLKDIKSSLELHTLKPGSPYYLGFMLVGAYQDTMGDLHNLFGKVNEAEVRIDEHGQAHTRQIRKGDSSLGPLKHFGFSRDLLLDRLRDRLELRVTDGLLAASERDALLEEFESRLESYTYLRPH